MAVFRLFTGDPAFPGTPTGTINPLNENSVFSADLWGYGRLPTQWPDGPVRLPSAGIGNLLWLVDPRAA